MASQTQGLDVDSGQTIPPCSWYNQITAREAKRSKQGGLSIDGGAIARQLSEGPNNTDLKWHWLTSFWASHLVECLAAAQPP